MRHRSLTGWKHSHGQGGANPDGACHVRLHDQAVEESSFRSLRFGRAIGDLGFGLDPYVGDVEAAGIRVLGLQDGVVRDLHVVCQTGVEVQPGMRVLGGCAEKPLQHQDLRRLFRILDQLRHEVGAALQRFLVSHGPSPLGNGMPLGRISPGRRLAVWRIKR
jgi:hypothetical protein